MASQASTMDKPLTVLDVFAHLLRHCHAAQFSHFCLDYGDHGLGISNDANVELVLARARHVTVQASHRGKYQEFWTLKRHLKHCSTSLGKLSLEITFKYIPGLDTYIGYDENFDEEEEEQEENDKVEPRGWKSLKELHLRLQGCIGSPPPSKFWSWLYKQCGQVETLEVSKFRRGADTGIAQAMLTYMPNLIELTVGSTSGRDTSPIKQDRVAKLLSGSSKGWKSVMLTGAVMSGPISMNALSKHFSTLEVLHLDHLSTCLSGRDLVQVLALCPNLRVVCCDSDLHEVHCDAFINQDPKTGELVTWACESTLKKLRIRICGFPGYDPRSPYDGGSTLQMLVYERLARLSNLETLSLGKAALTGALGSWLRIQRHQSNCLKMSLKSGLDMLSGLRSLKVLEVDGMETEAGIREVRWMTTHWPKLSALYGLDSRGNKEAIEWLKEHCPRIDLQAQSKSP
ncbi:hypothetical protein BGX31_006903 [Mortierella sp. GBA43]|nr:hypothetical protein BGX31_006903 [Mortierella sp. GBA43]